MADSDRPHSPFTGKHDFSARTPVRVLPLDEIEQMLAAHRLYLETERRQGSRADFGSAGLSGHDFSGLLKGADFTGAHFQRANLIGAILQEARLDHADLSGARLSGANLVSASLQNACLAEADLEFALMAKAVLCGACLRGADMRGG